MTKNVKLKILIETFDLKKKLHKSSKTISENIVSSSSISEFPYFYKNINSPNKKK